MIRNKRREETTQMSQNTHVGVANDRRPVNQKNIKKRRAQHQNVLEFLKSRAELEKAAK